MGTSTPDSPAVFAAAPAGFALTWYRRGTHPETTRLKLSKVSSVYPATLTSTSQR